MQLFEILPEIPLFLISLLYYLYIFALCIIIRRFLSNSQLKDTFLLVCLLETIAVVQLCAPIFDVDFILDDYGLPGVFVEIAFLEYVNWQLLEDELAHPFELFGLKETNLKKLAIFGSQLVGVALCNPVALSFWYIGLHSYHAESYLEVGCESDLDVSIWLGCLIEGLGTFAAHFIEIKVLDNDYEAGAISVSSGLITICGIRYTGMYFFPLEASACIWNCEGVSNLGHLVVYWLAPLIGWTVAERLTNGQEEEMKED